MEKWYIIRLYMKFYPKLDLYDWPLYYYKRQTEALCIQRWWKKITKSLNN